MEWLVFKRRPAVPFAWMECEDLQFSPRWVWFTNHRSIWVWVLSKCHSPANPFPMPKRGRLSKSNPVTPSNCRWPITLQQLLTNNLTQWLSKCRPHTSSSTWDFVRSVHVQALPRPNESKTWVAGVGGSNLFNEPSRRFWCRLKFENHWSSVIS